MGRKGAPLLLAVVVLWAATPAFACLLPMAQHSCCHQHAMQGCASLAMAGESCCQIQPSDPPSSPAPFTQTVRPLELIQPGLVADRLTLPDLSADRLVGIEAAPPLSLAGRVPILRI